MPRTDVRIPRGKAAKLIADIRRTLARAERDGGGAIRALDAIERTLVEAGIPALQPCIGEAHSNLHIDHCLTCAPRWGLVGPEVKVT